MQSNGIVFIDEIDKVALPRAVTARTSRVAGSARPADRGGEHSQHKYGPVKTDHVLFIAAGAHVAKVSDLPRAAGPISHPRGAGGARKPTWCILAGPRNAHPPVRLLGAEGVELVFEQSGIEELARIASEMNTRAQNIGARRLHTVLEKVLEEVSFSASELPEKTVRIDARYVRDKLDAVLKDEDLSRYIL